MSDVSKTASLSTPAIEARGVCKQFKSNGRILQALDHVSFTVEPSTVFAILGPNGAGKTTLLRILTTTLFPDSGTASVEGFDVVKQMLKVRQNIGIVAQSSNFDRYLTLWDNLNIHAQMHGMDKAEREKRIMALLETVGLTDRRKDYADDLSGGLRRRAALIRALIHKPKVLFLDEPTTGLDPKARREVWQTIEQLKSSTTVILTTHYMEEADRLSDRVMMINHGKVVLAGTPAELKKKVSPDNTYNLFLNTPNARQYAAQLANGITTEVINDHQLQLTVSDPDKLRGVLNQIDLKDFHQIGAADADLETVYLSLTGEDIR